MTFLQPWWWLLALLAIPLVLWHARNPRNLTVPSVRIWKAIAPDAARPNLDVRRFHWRPDRSLWVQLLALLALVIALAGPRPSDGVYDHHVWVLDRSASMAAPHGDETRWDAAVMEAVEALGASDAAVRGGPVNSVVTMGSDVSVAVARSDVRAHAARRIETTSVEDARAPVPASRVREAVRAVMVPNERTRITVLTDASGVAAANDALDSWAERDDGPVEVEIATFGETHRTHGFGSVRAVPLSPEDGEWRIEGEVLAYPPPEETLTVRARFERDDVEGALPWEALEVRLDGERTPFSFETEFPSAGVLTLSLPDDVLPGDDVARLALRDTPVQLRAWIAGEVPERLVEALEALDSTQVVRANGEVAGPPDAEAFDLAVVGPQANMDGRPAPTVLWLAGTSSEGEGASRLEAPAHVWSAGGSAAWTGVEDVPAGALDEVYELPSADHAEVLLRSEQGPLLQVRTSAHGTDIEAAWALGETVWARELGFATFLSEVSAMAQPRHGSWTDTRCIVGQPCPTASGDVAMEAPGVYEVSGTRWIVDVEAGPESNLQAEPPDVGGSNGLHVTAPWDRLDRSLAGIAALLLAFDAVRAWRRRRHGRRTVSPLRYWGAVALRIAAVVAAAFMAVGVPAPEVRFTEESVMVFDPSAWSGGSGAEGVQERWGRAARRGGASVWADGLGRLEAAGPWEEDLPSTRREAAAYDLAGVLRTAAATLGSSGGRLIVAGASGENGTVAHGLRDDLRARAVTVDVVPPPPLGDGEAWVTHIDVPDTIRSGDSVTVRVGVEGADATGRRVTVTVDGEVLARDEDAGPRAYSWEAPEPGSYELRAELAGDEAAGVPDNDVRRELVTVEPAGRVALVVVEEAERKVLGGRLEAQGFEVVAWRPRDVPASVDGFLAFDVVVVSDVPAVDLHPSRQESLERWVREHGGGVVVAGAKRAFGPGGYLRTPSRIYPHCRPVSPVSSHRPRSPSCWTALGACSRRSEESRDWRSQNGPPRTRWTCSTLRVRYRSWCSTTSRTCSSRWVLQKTWRAASRP